MSEAERLIDEVIREKKIKKGSGARKAAFLKRQKTRMKKLHKQWAKEPEDFGTTEPKGKD